MEIIQKGLLATPKSSVRDTMANFYYDLVSAVCEPIDNSIHNTKPIPGQLANRTIVLTFTQNVSQISHIRS